MNGNGRQLKLWKMRYAHTTREGALQIGPLTATAGKTHTVALPPDFCWLPESAAPAGDTITFWNCCHLTDAGSRFLMTSLARADRKP